MTMANETDRSKVDQGTDKGPLVDAQTKAGAMAEKGGHRLQENAQKVGHVASEIATKVVHSAQEAAQRVVNRVSEAATKVRHRRDELVGNTDEPKGK
jgi:hypothetical protein